MTLVANILFVNLWVSSKSHHTIGPQPADTYRWGWKTYCNLFLYLITKNVSEIFGRGNCLVAPTPLWVPAKVYLISCNSLLLRKLKTCGLLKRLHSVYIHLISPSCSLLFEAVFWRARVADWSSTCNDQDRPNMRMEEGQEVQRKNRKGNQYREKCKIT